MSGILGYELEKYLSSQPQIKLAGVVKLVDTPDLGSGAARFGGSSPFTRTYFLSKTIKVH